MIPRTPTSNMIPAKLKVAINTDALYSTSRQSKSCDTSTQRRNPLNNLPVPFRRHFGTRPMWQLILASLQASRHAHTPRTQLQVHTTPWNFDTTWIIRVKSGPLQCIRHFKIMSTLYVRLLAQPYNTWFKFHSLPNLHTLTTSLGPCLLFHKSAAGACDD